MKKTKKMGGFIDPYTLGFLLSLIGTATAHIIHSNDYSDFVKPENTTEQIEQTDLETDDEAEVE